MIIETIEAKGTGYTAKIEQIDPDEHPDLRNEGYHSTTTIYTIFNDGEVYCDHDPHRLIGSLPGDDRWVLDELDRLSDQL